MKRILGILLGVFIVMSLPLKPTPSPSPATKRPAGEVGVASWYGPRFHGRRTASGKRFNRYGFSCAHRTLPLGSKVRVEVLESGQTMDLTVTDRGPFVGERILDLSEGAANRLGVKRQGLAKVRITRIG